MFDNIKSRIWELLKEKEISLAMIFNRQGDILWHRGREVDGRSIAKGQGFSRSYCLKALKKPGILEEENVPLATQTGRATASTYLLRIRSLMILPIGNDFLLYLDSGARDSFSPTDRDLFRLVGDMLAEMIEQVRHSQSDIGGLSGTSPEIAKTRELVLRYSLEEAPVLLLGETGVGKSRVAELIHRYSGRKGKFCTVHTPSIPENLFESEIFGHRRGAFTDARADQRGFVDEARGGTLFFDEIAEVPLHFQVKLLRFIETRKYSTVGEPNEKEAEVRLLAATNKNLAEAVRRHEFREDLYYRLGILEIEIPPLRQRPEDIRALVQENQKLLKGKQPGAGFWEALANHPWPGNARELITVLTRGGIDSPDPISGSDIQALFAPAGVGSRETAPKPDKFERIEAGIRDGQDFWQVAWQPFIRRDLNRDEIREILRRGFEATDFSLKQLSRNFHVSDADYKKFIAILHKYAIHPKKSVTR